MCVRYLRDSGGVVSPPGSAHWSANSLSMTSANLLWIIAGAAVDLPPLRMAKSASLPAERDGDLTCMVQSSPPLTPVQMTTNKEIFCQMAWR